MIEFKNVSFSYRQQKIFDDLCFSLDDFTSAALLGLNGEGKTTFLKLLLGLLKPEKGRILIDGIDINRLNEEKRSRIVSYVPQDIDDSLSMPVFDFVAMGRIARRDFFKGPDEKEEEAVRSLLKQLGFEDHMKKDISALSSGQRRLIYLARAIYQDAGILVMDEPVSSLDLLKQHDLLSFLQDHLLSEDISSSFPSTIPVLPMAMPIPFCFSRTTGSSIS